MTRQFDITLDTKVYMFFYHPCLLPLRICPSWGMRGPVIRLHPCRISVNSLTLHLTQRYIVMSIFTVCSDDLGQSTL